MTISHSEFQRRCTSEEVNLLSSFKVMPRDFNRYSGKRNGRSMTSPADPQAVARGLEIDFLISSALANASACNFSANIDPINHIIADAV